VKPPSDVTVPSVIEPSELLPLSLPLLEALDRWVGSAPVKLTAAIDSSKFGLFDEGRMMIVGIGRSPVREPGGDSFMLGTLVLDTDARWRR